MEVHFLVPAMLMMCKRVGTHRQQVVQRFFSASPAGHCHDAPGGIALLPLLELREWLAVFAQGALDEAMPLRVSVLAARPANTSVNQLEHALEQMMAAVIHRRDAHMSKRWTFLMGDLVGLFSGCRGGGAFSS